MKAQHTPGVPNRFSIRVPYAVFRFNGEVVEMIAEQFEQAVRDGRVCGCDACLACRAREYKRYAER